MEKTPASSVFERRIKSNEANLVPAETVDGIIKCIAVWMLFVEDVGWELSKDSNPTSQSAERAYLDLCRNEVEKYDKATA